MSIVFTYDMDVNFLIVLFRNDLTIARTFVFLYMENKL